MALNKYQWELYLKAGGKQTVKRFADFLDGKFDGYPEFIKELVSRYCPDPEYVETVYQTTVETIDAIKNDKELIALADSSEASDNMELEEGEITKGDPIEIIKEYWDSARINNPKYNKPRDAFNDLIFPMIDHTILYSFIEPQFFFPYYFQFCFNVLSSIADMFEIELPPIPGKTQYLERFLYYAKLCNTFIDFANDNDLGIEELWAFLYDYAPSCIGGTDWVIESIADPHSIFVFGFGQYYPETEPQRKWLCQGNPEMQPGDIGLLYHWSPDSCFTSIWRAVSPGFYDPLGFHDRYVCYGNPIQIPRITFADLKADPIFKETSLVKQNMIRMDGAQMLPSEYMHLLEMARAKGEVPDTVPTFELHTEQQHGELKNERDVEMQLLEPLLLRLGWKPEDWCRQMPVRVGRGTSKYPDYVIKPVFTKYHERGEIVLEAKLTIPNKKQLETDQGQAHSYAKLLGARAYVLVSREGIWIAEKGDGYNEIVHYTWNDLTSEDEFTKVYNVLGNMKHNAQK